MNKNFIWWSLIILGFIVMIIGFTFDISPCKELGFDGTYGIDNHCYTEVLQDDGTILFESSKGRVKLSDTWLLILILGAAIFATGLVSLKKSYEED